MKVVSWVDSKRAVPTEWDFVHNCEVTGRGGDENWVDAQHGY